MSHEAKKRLGERIRRARHDASMKQGDLASKLGVSQGVISNVETGVSTIDAPDLPRWAEALNKPIMYFYLEEAQDTHRRGNDLLHMFSEEHIDMVFLMLENLAIAIQKRGLK